MKHKSQLSLVWISLATIFGVAADGGELAKSDKQANAKISAVMHDSIDDTVRRYLEAVKHADSIDELEEFLPSFRMKKFRNEFSARQKADWLRYRRQMPKIGKLVEKDIRRDKATLVYQTSEHTRMSHRKKQRTMAEITLVKEKGKWKVFLEHFGPENEKSWTKTGAARNQR